MRRGTGDAVGGDHFRASVLEQYMQTLRPGKPQPLGGGTSLTFEGRTRHAAAAVYKPGPLESFNFNSIGPIPARTRYGIPVGGGHLAAREVSASRLDEALGFGRVPPTGFVDGPFGRGSSQHWVHSTMSHGYRELLRQKAQGVPTTRQEKMTAALEALRRYPKVQREQMAVLDYVMGNTDRHMDNFRTGRDGDIVAIDNSLSFPETPDSRFGIRSPFVWEFRNVELSEEVLARVRAVDLDQLRAAWTDAGLSVKAINGAMDRLVEIRTHGAITGDAWPGLINHQFVERETHPLPTGWIES